MKAKLNAKKVESLWENYKHDIAQIADQLPASARKFSLSDWHCDPSDHRCLHDAWIEEIRAVEMGTGERSNNRSIEVTIKLLGAYHDRYFLLRFPAVRQYHITHPATPETRSQAGHGDVLDDSIALRDGYISYSLRLEFGRIEIECTDIEFSEEIL